ncbi:MAG: hypothetical protein M1343_11005 [Chloroflexi bacterium]|nr:hypothetical protein [Chloroflexota bacterium]
MDLSRLLNGEHWFDPNPGSPSAIYFILAFLFAVILGAGIYFYVSRQRLFKDHGLKLKLASQISTIGIALGFAGLALLVLRFLQVPYLSARALIYVVLLATLVAVVYYAYYFARVFPGQLATYDEQAMRRRYLAKPAPAAGRSAKKKKAKRRR